MHVEHKFDGKWFGQECRYTANFDCLGAVVRLEEVTRCQLIWGRDGLMEVFNPSELMTRKERDQHKKAIAEIENIAETFLTDEVKDQIFTKWTAEANSKHREYEAA
jgi:hypothetical protein